MEKAITIASSFKKELKLRLSLKANVLFLSLFLIHFQERFRLVLISFYNLKFEPCRY